VRIAVPVVLGVLEAVSPPDAGRPPLLFSLRTEAGLGGALAGRGGTLYRGQPEVVVGFHVDRVDVLGGGGLGPAYLVRAKGGPSGFATSASAALGVRLPVLGSSLGVLGRVEVVAGGGVAVTLDVGLSFDHGR
jgi:hypothetical protein